MSAAMSVASQKTLKFPATRPDRMLSDAPPLRDEVSTSRTWPELVEVKIFTNSGMSAPARVPQVMMADSFHQSVVSPCRPGMIALDAMKVTAHEMSEVNQTSEDS